MFSKPSPKPDQTSKSTSAKSLSDQPDSRDPVPSSDQIENRFAELKALIKSSDNSSNVHELSEIEIQFRIGLMDNISEGAIFVNKNKEIICWNRSAEVITGLTASNMIGVQFESGIIGLKPATSDSGDQMCALSKCLKTHKQISIEHTLVGKSGRKVNIALVIVPVIHSMQCHGAVILLRDLSANKDLKQQLTALKNSSSLDPLTHVANRAEFEKNLQKYATAHRATNSKCCLIIGDIDYFKMVNDTYGHNVGDQALVAFAQTLQQFVRSRDIVARYGGEEFVILCANCDIENAVTRAEQIRTSLTRTPQAMLDGKTLSASFGVAELLPKEDVTEFFVRADKALYTAKQNGRNRVERATDKKKKSRTKKKSNVEVSPATGIAWKKISKGAMFCEEYSTTTPSDLLADKLRGYITDNEAQILKIEPNYASIKVVAHDVKQPSKTSEFRVDIEFREFDELVQGQKQTCIRITVFPPIQRLFKKSYKELHSFLVSDIRRFFMLTDDSALVTLNPAATSSGRD